MADPEVELYFSVASLWEIVIKRSLGRADFQIDARVLRVLRHELIDNSYQEMAILSAHVVAVDTQPPIHQDPFDRLLIVQAQIEGITLLTNDALLAHYPGPIRLA
ncbi:MAG: type II toxin-antitoxin system VapC family toxin [Acidiphilium sp.]